MYNKSSYVVIQKKDKSMQNIKFTSDPSWKRKSTHVERQKSSKLALRILVIQISIFLFPLSLTTAQPGGKIFINAVVNQLLQVNQLRARNVIVSGDLFVAGSIINDTSSTSGGGSGGSGIQIIDGDAGSVTGSTVTIAGGNSSITNIATSGSGSTLTVSVSGTTENAVQVGSASGSLSSLALGTMGQVLTSNGSSSAPSFEDAGGIQAIDTAGGGTAIGPTVTFEPNITTNGQGTPRFFGNDASTILLEFGSESTLGIGTQVLQNTTGGGNTCFGADSCPVLVNGIANTVVGSSCATSLISGSNNNIFGTSSGTNYTGAESNNIIIGG